MKAASRSNELAEAQGYKGGQAAGATLGDVMRDKLAGLGGGKKKKGP